LGNSEQRRIEVVKKSEVIRAWKDSEYRDSVKDAPLSPAGLIELNDVALENVIFGGYNESQDLQNYASSTDTHGCTVSGVTVNSCGAICTLTTECTC
jgi:mersacidin/lichenicidin family type 2 lantibiotic